MTRTRNSGRVWAIAGGAVLLVGVITFVAVGIANAPAPVPTPTPTDSDATTDTPSSSPSSTPSDDPATVVDPDAPTRGWIGEPITRDPELYARAALAAAATFDTTLTSREDWLAYLDSWFTPDTRYNEDDRGRELDSAQLELRQSVVLPETEWDALSAEDGRVEAAADGELAFSPVPDDEASVMSIVTGDVTLMFTRSDGAAGEVSYEQEVRVSVQVLCGEGSIPTPGTAQQPGDCKVVRYFPEPLEP